MKEILETKTITEVKTYPTKVKVWCDRCGLEVELDNYRELEFRLEYKYLYSYPDGGGLEEGWMVEDLCPDCIEFLKDLLVKNGFQIEEIEEE